MTRLLAFDAAFDAVSVAVWEDGAVLAQGEAPGGRGQGERLMPLIAETMMRAAIGFDGLDCLAVTIGPGYFTGLRLGLAAARGLGLAAGKPVLGVTTFDAVLAAIPESERAGAITVVAFETKRADLYVQPFAAHGGRTLPLGAAFAREPLAAATRIPEGPLLLAGDGAHRLSEALPGRAVRIASAPPLPRAAWVARVAVARLSPAPGPLPSPEPLYLRPPDVTAPRHRTATWSTPSSTRSPAASR